MHSRHDEQFLVSSSVLVVGGVFRVTTTYASRNYLETAPLDTLRGMRALAAYKHVRVNLYQFIVYGILVQ